MPVECRKLRGKYRVVEKGTRRIDRTHLGKARDGGGHRAKAKCARQVSYINKRRE